MYCLEFNLRIWVAAKADAWGTLSMQSQTCSLLLRILVCCCKSWHLSIYLSDKYDEVEHTQSRQLSQSSHNIKLFFLTQDQCKLSQKQGIRVMTEVPISNLLMVSRCCSTHSLICRNSQEEAERWWHPKTRSRKQMYAKMGKAWHVKQMNTTQKHQTLSKAINARGTFSIRSAYIEKGSRHVLQTQSA